MLCAWQSSASQLVQSSFRVVVEVMEMAGDLTSSLIEIIGTIVDEIRVENAASS